MNNTNLFVAPHIILTALDAKKDAPTYANWTQDSRFIPFVLETKPPRPLSEAQAKEWLDEILKESDDKRTTLWMGIRPPDESELLGIITIHWVDWGNSAAHCDLMMKNEQEFGEVSAKEALALLLNYAFNEINLNRLHISLPAYNLHLAESLQSFGFVEEVRRREAKYHAGKRWDVLHYGILRDEYEKTRGEPRLFQTEKKLFENLYGGKKVNFAAIEPKEHARRMKRWQRDTEISRLADSAPVRLWNISQNIDYLEKLQKSETFESVEFAIIADEKVIGSCGLDGIIWQDRTSWVGIVIGERAYWGKGYGTDAMRKLARYAFEELDLHRLNLNVFSYNKRAIRAYEKVGYCREGKVREAIYRDGKYWDLIFMGLLREDFKA